MMKKIIKLMFLTLFVHTYAADVSISQTRTSDWNSGFCETVEVRNISSGSIQWQIEFTVDGIINNLWSANYTQDSNRKVVASGVSWNSTLWANQTTSFGYCADKVAIPPSTDSSKLVLTKTKTASWNGGFCEAVKITNNESVDVIWDISTPVEGEIYEIWSATYTQGDDLILNAKGLSWNEIVKANSTREFGYCANAEDTTPINTDKEDVIKDKNLLTFDVIRGTNSTQNDIKTQLSLIVKGVNDSDITWSSSDSSIISTSGVVTRPESTSTNQSVTLTAVLTKGVEQEVITFILTVTKKEPVVVVNTDAEDVATNKALLTFDMIKNLNTNASNINTNLTLVSAGSLGTAITWSSSNTAVISNIGVVTRSENDETVTLTATITKGLENDTKRFTLLVVKEVIGEGFCQVDYNDSDEWSTGASVAVVITNQLGNLNSWEVTFTFPSGQTFNGDLWNGVETQTGSAVSILNETYNGTVSDGGNIEFGFNLKHNGTNDAPTDIRLNGKLCDAQSGSLDVPTSPSSLNAELIDNTKVNLTWLDNSDNEDAFIVYKNVNDAGWELITSLAANTQSYDNFVIETDKNYKFKVEARNLAGVSSSEVIDVNPLNVAVQSGADNDAVALVANCMACHTQTNSHASTPVIHGLSKTYLEQTLKSYRTSDTTVNHYSFAMHRIMDGYSDAEIDLMTEYFSSQTWVGNDVVSYDVQSITLGKTLYETNCVACHGTDAMQDDIMLSKQSEQYLVDTMTNYAKGFHKDAHVGMKSVFENTIGDNNTSIEALAKYLAVGLEVPTDTNDTIRGFTAKYVSDTNKILASWEYISPEVIRVDVLVNGMVVQTLNDLTDLSVLINNDGTNVFALEESYDVQIKAVTASNENLSSLISVLVKTDEMYGEEHYNTNCKVCHGVNGTARADITTWNPADHSFAQYTQASIMPASYYANCDEECLDLIGVYVLNVLEPRAREDNSTEVTDVNSDISRGYRLLNSVEYTNTLYTLFEIDNDSTRSETLALESTDLPEDNIVEGYNTDRDTNRIDENRLKAFVSMAERIEVYVDTLKGKTDSSCLINGYDFCVADKNEFLSTFGTNIFRRPLNQTEIDQYVNLESIGQIVGDMLVSPNFLYRSEIGTETNTTGIYKLTQYEIATAISYTVAGTTPDSELLALAESSQLLNENTRVTQAVRLSSLQTGKDKLDDFIGRWLLKDNVFSLSDKNPERFPGYDNSVRTAQGQQVLEYFRMVMQSNSKSAYKDLFVNDYIMTNSILSNYYQNGLSSSQTFEKVAATSKRNGVLTLGALASRYANSEESHPFKRGEFVLARLMCHEIGTPQNAGDVPAVQEHAGENKRDRFAEHVNDPSCATCHVYMDPIGYTWENYDGTGRYRTSEYHSEDDGGPKVIDASVTLKGLLTLDESETYPASGINDVSQIIADSDRGPECMALQYYRYVSGDTAADLENSLVVEKIVADFKDEQYDLQSLFTNIVKLNSFITRKGE